MNSFCKSSVNGSLVIVVIQGEKVVLVIQGPDKFMCLSGAIFKIEFNFLAYSQIYHYQKFTRGRGLRCLAICMFLNGGILEKCHDGFVGVIY